MREHTLTTRVRFGETDKMGVVYHPNYIVYFELGRTELMRKAGLAYSEMERSGYLLVVTEVGAKYRSKAVYDEEISIHTRVAEIGRASLRFEYKVTAAGGRLLAEGFTGLACLDSKWKPVRLPEAVASLLR